MKAAKTQSLQILFIQGFLTGALQSPAWDFPKVSQGTPGIECCV